MDTECWMKIFSVTPWLDLKTWCDFYTQTEDILSARLTYLDTNDPPKRKVERSNFELSAKYMIDFKSGEQSRWLFGKYVNKNIRIDITVQHHKNVRITNFDFPNCISLFFPNKYCDSTEGINKIITIFNIATSLFNSFYSIADLRSIICKKRKQYGAVNLQEELLGIFWLTFFNNQYSAFFGYDKLAKITQTSISSHGITLRLADGPRDCSEVQRKQVEELLGVSSFVDPEERTAKPVGRSVLSFKQLSF